MSAVPDRRPETGKEAGYTELVRYTLPGYAIGLALGALLDALGFQRSALGQWAVRTIAGESESVFEGLYALRQRFRQAAGSMAEAYGWGKLIGMTFPWAVDGFSRLLGVDVDGVPGFYIPYFYGLSDQIGANVSGFVFLARKEGSLRRAGVAYFQDPVMLSSLVIILIVPVGLFLVRSFGFSPTTQVYTALETMAANLCWIPPVVGWLRERAW